MGKRLRTEIIICPLSVCHRPRSDPSAAAALRGSQAGSPCLRYPGKAPWGSAPDTNLSPSRDTGAPARREAGWGRRADVAGWCPAIPGDAFSSFSLKSLCGGSGDSSASSPARWGPCPTAVPAWGQMPSPGATPGVSALSPSPEPCFYRLVFKPDGFYEEGTRLRAPPWRAAAPSYCTGFFWGHLGAFCPFTRSPLRILGTAPRHGLYSGRASSDWV